MIRTSLLSVAAVAMLGLVAWGGVVVADGHPHGAGVLERAHQAAHMHKAIGHLIDELQLDEGQQQRIDTIHELLMSRMADAHQAHGMHLAALLRHLDDGQLTSDVVRQTVDQHVEQLRDLGYRLGDELVALVDSLNADQRAILTAHLDKAAENMQGHGH